MLRLNHWGKRLLTITTKKKHTGCLKILFLTMHLVNIYKYMYWQNFKRSQGVLFVNGLASINFSSKLLHIQRQ